MHRFATVSILLILSTFAVATVAGAEDADPVAITPTLEDASNDSVKRPYSPYAGRGFPTEVYWGDTHVHTYNSLDARGFGVTIGPEVAYRFADHRGRLRGTLPKRGVTQADRQGGQGLTRSRMASATPSDTRLEGGLK